MKYEVDHLTSDVVIFNEKQIFRYDQTSTSLLSVNNVDKITTYCLQSQGRFYVSTEDGYIFDLNEDKYNFLKIDESPVIYMFQCKNSNYACTKQNIFMFDFSTMTKAKVFSTKPVSYYHKSHNELFIAHGSTLSICEISQTEITQKRQIKINAVIKYIASSSESFVILTQSSILIYDSTTYKFKSSVQKAFNMKGLTTFILDKVPHFATFSVKDNTINIFQSNSDEFQFQIKSPYELQFFEFFGNQKNNIEFFCIYGNEMVQFYKKQLILNSNMKKFSLKIESQQLLVQPPKVRIHPVSQTLPNQDIPDFDIPALEQALRQADLEQISFCLQEIDTSILQQMTESGKQLLIDFLVQNFSPHAVFWLKQIVLTEKLTQKQKNDFTLSMGYYQQQKKGLLKLVSHSENWGGQIGEIEPVEEIEEW